MKNNLNFILTGVTGVLGSHIFYELMLKLHENQYEGNIVLLLRSKPGKTYMERFDELFTQKLLPNYLKQVNVERIRHNNVTLIDLDLNNISEVEMNILQQGDKYHLIHCAASVNLGNSPSAYEEIKKTNYNGTLQLLEALKPYIFKLTYISTAFAYRPLEYNDPQGYGKVEYRNHYEKFKAQVEEELFKVCAGYGLQCQVLRPSIICGRLIDYPHHVIGRFLVFYLFGAFFYRIKETPYNNLPLRITINHGSGLNIVAVDYAAKAIVRALNTDIRELNIVSSKYVPNTYTIPALLKEVGWHNFEFTDMVPTDMNAAEKLYYRTVGPQLNDYLLAPDYEFDVEVLMELMKDIEEPDIYMHFRDLCRYAVEQKFNNILA